MFSTRCKNTADKVNHAILAGGYGAAERAKNYWGPALGGSMGKLRPCHVLLDFSGLINGSIRYFWMEQRQNMCNYVFLTIFIDQGQYMRSTQSNMSNNNNTREIAGKLLLGNKVIWQIRTGGTQFIYTED